MFGNILSNSSIEGGSNGDTTFVLGATYQGTFGPTAFAPPTTVPEPYKIGLSREFTPGYRKPPSSVLGRIGLGLGLILSLSGDTPQSVIYNVPEQSRYVLIHYTNRRGLDGILSSQTIWPSLRANNPKDARYGDGVYFTDYPPGTLSNAQLARRLIRVPNPNKFTHFVAVDVSGLTIYQHDPYRNIYVHWTQTPLSVAGRIVAAGPNE